MWEAQVIIHRSTDDFLGVRLGLGWVGKIKIWHAQMDVALVTIMATKLYKRTLLNMQETSVNTAKYVIFEPGRRITWSLIVFFGGQVFKLTLVLTAMAGGGF